MPNFTRFHVLFVLLLLWLGSLRAVQAQAPANDDPCGALPLPLQGSTCLTPTASTNVGATTTVPNGYGNAGSPRDVWFRFTTAATGAASFGATITVTGSPAGFVQLFSAAATGCTGPLTSLDFSPAAGQGAPNTAAPRLITGLLTPSTVYYVRVAGFADSDLTGAFTICVSDGPSTPTCGQPRFTLTYPNGVPTLTFTPGVNNVPPYAVTVRDALTNNPVLTTTSPTGAPLPLPALVAGSAYSITVTASCAGGGQGVGFGQFTVPLVNDEPCGAIALSLNGTVCTPVSASNAAATASAAANALLGPTCFGTLSGAAQDVWFSVQTAATGPGSTTLNLTTTGLAARRLRLLRASSCAGPFTIVGCAVNTSVSLFPETPLVATGLTPSTTYYVLVDQAATSAPGTPGAFTICAASVPPCAAPGSPTALGVTTTTAQVAFSAPDVTPAPTSYTVTYTPQGGTATTVTTPTPSVTLSNLLPGTLYTVCVVSNCAGGGQSPPACSTFTTVTPVSCAAPTGLSVTGITNTTASLTFGAAAGATSYVVALTPQGGTPQTLSPNPTTAPVALTGLLPGVTYTVTVQTVCPAGVGSVVSTTFTTTSTGLVQYCTTGLGGDCLGPIITSVTIPGTTLNNLGTSCGTANGSAYTAYPATGSTTATLYQGQPYQYRITPTLNNNADLVAWIDFNQNGQFEASEGVQVALNAAAGLPVTATFTVPATAVPGFTGMRVRCRGAGAGLGVADACTATGSGETEDYRVTISPPLGVSDGALAAQVSLYPNPAHQAVTLTWPRNLLSAPTEIRLLTMLGQVVARVTAPTNASQVEVPLRELAPGLYFVQLRAGATSITKRVVVN